jgi:large subunit ribosomal protein L25
VRVGGGVLDQIMHEVQIEADPADIPNHIDVDVTEMAIATTLHVSDLPLPRGVTIVDDPDLTVCVLAPPRVEEAAPAADGSAEPEVIRKAKTEEGAA